MAIQVYINFNGNCREAVEFYAGVFKTEKPKIMLFGDVPPDPQYPLTEQDKKKVMHTELNILGSTVMFSDIPSDMPFVAGNNFSLTVITKDIEEVKSSFNQIKEKGSVIMDLQETFWSKCYGSVVDQFGIIWQFSLDSGEMTV